MSDFSRRGFVKVLAGVTGALLLAPRAFAGAVRKSWKLIQHLGSNRTLETPLDLLGRSWRTPNEFFFVLSRTASPRLPSQLTVHSPSQTRRIPFADLFDRTQFRQVEFPAVLQCAGFGRQFFRPALTSVFPEAQILNWGVGAVGNSVWSGVPLRDVLRALGMERGFRHAAFCGAESSPERRDDFIKSIPAAKALDRRTILALSMNGQPLPREHGGPVRLLVPGWIGAYSTKWLAHILLRDKPWAGEWMTNSYTVPLRPIAPGSDFHGETRPLAALSVNSIITDPLEGRLIASGRCTIRGFAWTGEAEIETVEVSIDRGAKWSRAKLGREKARYAWRSWSCQVALGAGEHQIMARATDIAGATQPLGQDNWNPGGYDWHAAHRVSVRVV